MPINPLSDQTWLATGEVAELLDVPPNRLAKWRSLGKSPIPFRRFGRSVVYSETEVLAYRARQRSRRA